MALPLISQCEEDIDYSDDNICLITWNPNNKFVGTDCDIEMKWDTMVLKHLKHLTRCSRKFCIVAELSPTGRLHCHGWFSLDDKYKWNKSVYPHFFKNGNIKYCKMRSAKALWYYKKEVEKTVKDTALSTLVYSHRNHKLIRAELKQKYENKALAAEKVHKVKSILDYAAFFGFQDSILKS